MRVDILKVCELFEHLQSNSIMMILFLLSSSQKATSGNRQPGNSTSFPLPAVLSSRVVGAKYVWEWNSFWLLIYAVRIFIHNWGGGMSVNVRGGRVALPLHLFSWSLPAPPPAPPDLHLDSFSAPLSAYVFRKWQIEQLTHSMCRFWG